MGVSQVTSVNRNATTKTKTIGRFSVEATVQKPKERQFQVVPVPCVFTRGRWKCWDYKIGTDISRVTPDILEFAEKTPATTEKTAPIVADAKVTTPVIEASETSSAPVFTHSITACDITSSICDSTLSSCSTPVGSRESSTIVVTSIEPAQLTPVHSAIQESSDCTDGVRASGGGCSPTKHRPSCALHGTDLHDMVMDTGEAHSRVCPLNTSRKQSPPPYNISPPPLHRQGSVPTLSRQASIQGFPTQDASIVVSPTQDIAADDGTSLTSTGIDNKIEQAMDLVKTHLTYAVREEVDILRSHIVDLEIKVTDLERQNQFLRQFAPPEVLANLTILMQQQRVPTMPQQAPVSQMSGLPLQSTIQQAVGSNNNRNTFSILPSTLSSTGGSPKGSNESHSPPPSMIPKLNRPSGIPLPNSSFETMGVRRSPEPVN